MKPADVTPIRQEQPTEVNPVVPSDKTDLEAVAELAEAHAQITREIEKRIIGQRAVVSTPQQVRVAGELWEARSDEELVAGEEVVVTGLEEGLKLRVSRSSPALR